MTFSIAVALLGALAGFAAMLVLAIRHFSGATDQLSLALAQSSSARRNEREPSASGAGLDAALRDQARAELVREPLEPARAGQSRWAPISGDRVALLLLGLSTLAIGCFLLLTTIDGGTPAAPSSLSTGTVLDADIARLQDYLKLSVPRRPATDAMSRRGELPDVETMIERLATRLQTAPEDAEGWRMLGWSYFNTGRAAKAVDAYARAVALQPESLELKSAYDEALAAVEASAQSAGFLQPTPEQVASIGSLPAEQQQAAIRGMVSGLADRLEKSPRDEEGWLRLLHSRTVLGEQQAARETLAKALAAFSDDESTRARITATAKQLGLSNN
jgi:cytochrome c-type biogenesis protein CcmH